MPLLPILRTRLLAPKKRLLPFTHAPSGEERYRFVPAIPSAEFVPPPATVLIIPFASTFRMRPLPVSEKYTLPLSSTAIPFGALSAALVAGPPSPENPPTVLPLGL